MRTITLCRTRSIDTASAIAPASCRTPTALSIFTFRIPLRRAMNSNWLPAPSGNFILWLRVYLPGKAILDGRVQGATGRRNPMMSPMKHKHLITFGSVMVVAWAVGTFLFIYFWPHLVMNHFKRAIVDQGFGDGPIPINTLYTEPQKLFGDPLHTSLPPGSSNLMTVGVNHDTLLDGRLARPLQRTASIACAGLFRPLLQRAVHRPI